MDPRPAFESGMGTGGLIISGVLGIEILRGDGWRMPWSGILGRRRRGAGDAAGILIGSGGVTGAPSGAGWRSGAELRAALVTGERRALLAELITRAEVDVYKRQAGGHRQRAELAAP